MRSNEERISEFHKRVAKLQCKRQKRILAACTVACSAMFVALIGMITYLAQPTASFTGASYAGASLIDGSVAGGYVLIATVAFMLGIILAVLVRKYREYSGRQGSDGDEGSNI